MPENQNQEYKSVLKEEFCVLVDNNQQNIR